MEYKERTIEAKATINATLEQAWDAWTTREGIVSFLAPDCDVEFEAGGKYEIYFNPDAPYGEKGGEGLQILAIDPQKMLSFTWNAPPHLPNVRKQWTHVVVRFFPVSENQTEVLLRHDGWGSSDEWDQAFDYFGQAWKKIVLPRLKYRFEVSAIDWSNPPSF